MQSTQPKSRKRRKRQRPAPASKGAPMSGGKHVHAIVAIGELAQWCSDCGALRLRSIVADAWGHWRRPGRRVRRAWGRKRGRQLELWTPSRLDVGATALDPLELA